MASALRNVVSSTLRSFVTAVLLAGLTGMSNPAWSGDAGDRDHRATCLVIDTDVATDDFRAFAVLFPHRDLRAVVVTEGIASVPRGSTAISLFLASGQSLAPVIPGLAAAAPPAYDWLPAARAAAERINGFLAESVPFAAAADDLNLALARALRHCARVEVLVLGPWSSFVRYAPMLRPLIRRVVASGRPLAENHPDNFNCVYDQPACDAADKLLRRFRTVVWVDLPADGASYPPTQEMVDELGGAGMPGVLRAALNADPSQWLGTRLWDDAAALYLLAPGLFVENGAHLEPAVGEETLRDALVNAINSGAAD
jgi:inosine-uridine nucleoside N-ribohydrolase